MSFGQRWQPSEVGHRSKEGAVGPTATAAGRLRCGSATLPWRPYHGKTMRKPWENEDERPKYSEISVLFVVINGLIIP